MMNHHPNGSVVNNAANYGVYAGVGGSASGARVASAGVHENGFYRSTWTTGSSSNGGIYTYTNKTLKPNTQYLVSAYLRSSVTKTLNPGLECYPESGSPRISTIYPATLSLSPNVWTQLKFTATLPANCVSVTLTLYSTAGWPAGATEDVDAIMVTEGSFEWEYIESRQKFSIPNERSFYRQRSGLSSAPVSQQRHSFLRSAVTDPKLTTVNDLEFAYYSSLSGLTPANKYSLMDHKMAAWA